MKKIFALLTMFPTLAFSSTGETKYFKSLEESWHPKKSAYEKIEKARKTAIEFLTEAQKNLNDTFNQEEIELSYRAQKLLKTVPILLNKDIESKGTDLEPFYDFQLCWDRKTIVNTDHENHTLRVCKRSLFIGVIDLAQVFVHESFHLAGLMDECEVSSLEIRVINETKHIPHMNGYVFYDKCDLRHLFTKGKRAYSRETPFLEFFPKRFLKK